MLRRQVKIIQNNDVVYVDSNSSSPPTVIHGRGGVCGVTSLGDDVFVVRDRQHKIEVYDAKNFTLQRHITVPGLVFCFGLVACPYNNCIYIYLTFASAWYTE